MTQPATLNGQVIGQAERTTRAVLEVLLAETDTAFTNWVALNLVGTVRLTADGRARYQRISDGIADITQRLYHSLPTDDLVVARRVLQTLTERARAELANAS
ncbi:MAG: hypothetical protein ABI706_19265 [Ilumatobacteraceae bacterium]